MSDASVGTVTINLELDGKAFDRALATAETKAQVAGRKIDRELSGATQRTEERFASFGSIATRALTATGVAAGVAGLASIKMAGDFEQSLNVFQSVSGATAKQMELVADKARELGKDATLPGISARDAAQALTELAKAGLTVNDSLAASKGVLSLAKAGNLAVADAAAIAARALNAFGLGGEKATQVADILAAAANASSGGVNDFALALQQASAAASRLKIPLGDTVTALALFSNNGINGSDAGTSLKTMLASLVPTTKKEADAMRELGLDFFDAKGNFIGLEKTATLLQTKLGKLSQEQRELAINTIFGSDASRAAGILAKEGAKGFDSMSAAVNRQGAATKLAASQNAGFNGALDNLISTLQTIGTDLGTKVLPPITEFLRLLAQKLPPAVDFVTEHFDVLAKSAIALGLAFGTIRLAAFVSDLVLAQKNLAIFIGPKNAAGIRAIGVAFAFMGRSALAGFAAIRAGAITAKLALVSTGIGILVVALGLAAEQIIIHWDEITKYFQSLGTRLQPFLLPVAKAFDELSTTVARIADEAGKKLLPALEEVGRSLQGPVGDALQTVLGFSIKLAELFAITLVQSIAIGLTALAGFIQFVNAAILKLEVFVKAAKDKFDEIKSAAENFGRDVADKITSGFGAAVDFVVESFDRMVEAAKPWQRDFKGTLTKTLNDAAKAMIDYDIRTLKSWKAWIDGTLAATGKWAGEMAEKIGSAVAGFFKQVGDTLSALPTAVGHWFDETIKRVEQWGTNLLTNGGKAASDFVNGVVQFFADLPATIGQKLEGIAATVSAFFTGLPGRVAAGLSDSGTRASGSFVDGLNAYLKKENTVRKIGDTIVGAFLLVVATIGIYLLDAGFRIAGKIIEGISKGVTGTINAGTQLIAGLVRGLDQAQDAVIRKIIEICGRALDAVKKFFGIRSPSTVMAGLGENLMKGLAEGISKAGSQATSAMTGVSQDLVAALNVPSGSFSLAGDVSGGLGGGGSRTLNQNNVYNVYNQADAELIANETAWRAARAA